MIDDKEPIYTISEFPNSNEDLLAALYEFKLSISRNLSVCFPACVYSYDRHTHKASVMPLVKATLFDGEYKYIRRKPYEVTVRNIQCGGVTIDFPVYVGDTGWVIASDRDTTLAKQNEALTTSVLENNRKIEILEDDYQVKPYQPVLHSFQNGFFIPDNWGRWETWRYKDNPHIAIDDSVYIGNSFDTLEDRPDVGDKKFQKGDKYEQNPSSSLVLSKNGMISLSSSTAKEEAVRGHVETAAGRVQMIAEDDKTPQLAQVSVDAKTGITIRHCDDANNAVATFNITPNKTIMVMAAETGTFQLSIENGKVSLSTSGGMNINAGGPVNFKTQGELNIANTGNMRINSQGSVNVIAQQDATVSATGNARVNAGGNVEVSTANEARVSARRSANVSAGESVNIAAGDTVNIASKSAVNLVTGGNTTVMSKKKGAKILVTSLSKESDISIVAKGSNSNIAVTLEEEESSLEFKTKKKNSPITITTTEEGSAINIETQNKSNIDIKAGEESNIAVSADKGKIDVTAKQDISLTSTEGNININATHGNLSAQVLEGNATIGANKATVTAKDITMDGTLKVTGNLQLQDKWLGINSYRVDQYTTLEYYAPWTEPPN